MKKIVEELDSLSGLISLDFFKTILTFLGDAIEEFPKTSFFTAKA